MMPNERRATVDFSIFHSLKLWIPAKKPPLGGEPGVLVERIKYSDQPG